MKYRNVVVSNYYQRINETHKAHDPLQYSLLSQKVPIATLFKFLKKIIKRSMCQQMSSTSIVSWFEIIIIYLYVTYFPISYSRISSYCKYSWRYKLMMQCNKQHYKHIVIAWCRSFIWMYILPNGQKMYFRREYRWINQ